MYRKLVAVLCILVVLSMATSSVAMAMPDVPVNPVTAPVHRQTNAYPQHSATPYGKAATTSGEGPLYAQAIAFGPPTAFRFDKTFGVTEEAYINNPNYLNGATGLTVDASGNVYIVEENGARLLKFAPDKTLLWQAGIAGMHDWGMTGLNWPREVIIGPDGMLWVADNEGVSWFDPANGNYTGRFPAEPWNATEETRFRELRGIAFDSAGRVYLSDRWRHRIQVFDTSGDGPTYVATIGMTDESGDDVDHFTEPAQIVIDSLDNLYVADIQNSRVQKCEPNPDFSAWECSTFAGTGDWGGNPDEFAFVYGLGIDASDVIYITDNANGRVKACSTGLGGLVTCNIIITDRYWPSDVAVDATTGNLYISIYNDFVVDEYTPAGTFVRRFAGVQGTPYLTDANYLNGPRAVETDSKGNVFIAEEWGQRITKRTATGVLLWSKGTPGIGSFNPEDLNAVTNPTAMALDPTGKKLVVAEMGWLIRIYDAATGNYLSDLTRDEDHYRFDYVNGIAYDRTGNLYISDRNAQIINVYNKAGVFLREMGVRYERGPDSLHFDNPTGLATDTAGNLYVADHDNCRVQKFDKKGYFLMTFGTARCGGTYDRMGGPIDVAVDAKGNVYVAEEWNARVSVYSSKGVYMGYIGGDWTSDSAGLRNPSGVAVDSKGLVYVADMNNARVQRFAMGVPYAAKISQDNFGGRDYLMVFSLAMFQGQLYAGTSATGPGAQIWRQTKTGWENVIVDGFEDGGNGGIDQLYEYKGYLYASTYHCTNEDCSTSNGGQVWRSPDGLTWQPVTTDGFGNPDAFEIFRLAKLGTQLCASTIDFNSVSELWCSTSGEPGTWQSQITPGFGEPGKLSITALQEFNGMSFAGGESDDGAVMFRKTATIPWTKIDFPQETNLVVADLAVYKGYLYAITHGAPGNAAQIRRCLICDGSDWVQVDNGFGGNPKNRRMGALEATKTALYAITGNMDEGLTVWKSTDGLKWTQVSSYGLGTPNNSRVYWGNSVTTNGTTLYLGTIARTNGSAVWKICSASACK